MMVTIHRFRIKISGHGPQAGHVTSPCGSQNRDGRSAGITDQMDRSGAGPSAQFVQSPVHCFHHLLRETLLRPVSRIAIRDAVCGILSRTSQISDV